MVQRRANAGESAAGGKEGVEPWERARFGS